MEGDRGKGALEGRRELGEGCSPQPGIHHTLETRPTIVIHSAWEFQTQHSYLRQIVWIRQLGCHIEPKTFIIINVCVSKVNEQSSTTCEGLFQKNGF